MYGCLLYSPIEVEPFNVCVYNYDNFFNDLNTAQEDGLKSLIAWLIYEGNHKIEDLRKNPVIDSFLTGLGITEDLSSFLVDKTCQLAFVGLTLLLKGKTGGIVGNEIFMYGCESILKIALHYTERNHNTVANFPIVVNSYININVEYCEPNISLNSGNQLPSFLSDCNDNEWEAPPVLMPDSAAFTNKGKYLILFWVMESNPRYSIYTTQTQLYSPIPEIWDVVDSDGNIIHNKADTVWDNYFKDIQRTIGYQFAKYYCNEFREPIMKGNFKDKEDANQFFESAMRLTTLTPRDKAPITYSASTKDEYLKELSREGEKLVLKKVNVVEKKPWLDSAEVLITYKATNLTVP